jgi:lipoate-protein ligase A
MKPMHDKHLYNLEKITLRRLKADSIFDVDMLVASLEKFLLIKEIEIDECQTMFTEKFFAHFASKRKEIRFVPNIRHIKLNKVILN